MLPGGGDVDYDGLLLDESENEDDDKGKGGGGDDDDNKGKADDDNDDDSYYDPDENDVMAAIRRRQKKARKEAEQAIAKDKKATKNSMFTATRWEDSQVSREQAARAASAARAGQHDTVRDSQDAAAEAAEREEEKARLFGRDPLGLLNFEDYDLRRIEKNQAEQMEQALQEINEEIQKTESVGNDELVKKATSQKESLEQLIDRMGGIEAMENALTARASILPTNPKFDPILFLTLLHRKTPYNTLIQSLDRLSRKYIRMHMTSMQNTWFYPSVSKYCSFLAFKRLLMNNNNTYTKQAKRRTKRSNYRI